MVEKRSEKIVHFRLADNPEISVYEIYQMIEKLEKSSPDRDFFFDGDEQAICSRPKIKQNHD